MISNKSEGDDPSLLLDISTVKKGKLAQDFLTLTLFFLKNIVYNDTIYPYARRMGMEREERMVIHDTINLDEIRSLIADEAKVSQVEDHITVESDEVPLDSYENGDISSTGRSGNILLELYDMLHDLVYILAAVTLIFVFLVRVVGVDGESMLPTLHNRDFLLLESNFLYDVDDINAGDVVVLNVPYYWERDRSLIVKRVIATEGQTVDIDYENNIVYVDGVALQEDYINEQELRRIWDGSAELILPATVPEGHIFVLGDNRNNSSDSRFAPVGMIDERCVLGKAWVIALPGQTKDSYGNITSPRQWSRIGTVS